MGSSFTNIVGSFNTNNTTNNYSSPPGYGHNINLNHGVRDISGLTKLLNDALNNGLRSLSRLHVSRRHGVEVPSENKNSRDWANNTISDMLQNGMQNLQYMTMMRGLMGNGGSAGASLGNQSNPLKGMLG